MRFIPGSDLEKTNPEGTDNKSYANPEETGCTHHKNPEETGNTRHKNFEETGNTRYKNFEEIGNAQKQDTKKGYFCTLRGHFCLASGLQVGNVYNESRKSKS